MVRVKICGVGGQGIALSGWLLGYAATIEGKYSSVHNSYGAEVRGGSVVSSIVIEDSHIDNPFVEEYNYYIILHSIGWRHISNKNIKPIIIADMDLAKLDIDMTYSIEWKPFDKISRKYDVPINIVALGYLSKRGIVSIDSLHKSLEARKIDTSRNIKALGIGLKL
jgi:Pyruvate/2-oxoacid:ferredoxin oxidoreductase gamma subunit